MTHSWHQQPDHRCVFTFETLSLTMFWYPWSLSPPITLNNPTKESWAEWMQPSSLDLTAQRDGVCTNGTRMNGLLLSGWLQDEGVWDCWLWASWCERWKRLTAVLQSCEGAAAALAGTWRALNVIDCVVIAKDSLPAASGTLSIYPLSVCTAAHKFYSLCWNLLGT